VVWPYEASLPQYRRPRHFHAEPEFNLIVAGTARFGVGARTVDTSAGEILSFLPGQDHVLLSGSKDLLLFAVGSDSELSREAMGNNAHRMNIPHHARPAPAEFRRMVDMASSLSECENADSRIAELWERVYCCRGMQGVANGDDDVHVFTRRTLEILDSAAGMSRDALAQCARANPTEISRHFHRNVGMTLAKYRARQRLLSFIGLVDRQPGNLTAAAMDAGFGSYSQCYRTFYADLGCAPQEFFATGLRERMEHAFDPMPSLFTKLTAPVPSPDSA